MYIIVIGKLHHRMQPQSHPRLQHDSAATSCRADPDTSHRTTSTHDTRMNDHAHKQAVSEGCTQRYAHSPTTPVAAIHIHTRHHIDHTKAHMPYVPYEDKMR